MASPSPMSLKAASSLFLTCQEASPALIQKRLEEKNDKYSATRQRIHPKIQPPSDLDYEAGLYGQ